MQHSDTREYWDRRFSAVDAEYFSGLKEIVAMNPPILDLIHHFPVFTGAVNIGRFLALYEAFKQVEGIAGHYADVGTWTGASYMYIAKLMKLFEPNTPYQVHAFDWFKGMKPDSTTERQNYQGDYDRLVHLLKVQHLDDVAVVHNLNLTTDLPAFGADPVYAPIYYKYVFMDCGMKEVLEKALPFFWDRLVTGGIMVFDHFGSEVKVETDLVRALVPAGTVVKMFPFARQPMGYVIK